MPPMPPMSGMAGAADLSSGASVTMASVVAPIEKGAESFVLLSIMVIGISFLLWSLWRQELNFTTVITGLLAGSAFAVIPAQNATGNWIKVVQRLPVRIAIDPADLAAHPLKVGLSMTATIRDTPRP